MVIDNVAICVAWWIMVCAVMRLDDDATAQIANKTPCESSAGL